MALNLHSSHEIATAKDVVSASFFRKQPCALKGFLQSTTTTKPMHVHFLVSNIHFHPFTACIVPAPTSSSLKKQSPGCEGATIGLTRTLATAVESVELYGLEGALKAMPTALVIFWLYCHFALSHDFKLNGFHSSTSGSSTCLRISAWQFISDTSFA